MTKIIAPTLEQAYRDAAVALECSITELNIEVIQSPSSGVLGMFKKSAIIVAVVKPEKNKPAKELPKKKVEKESKKFTEPKIELKHKKQKVKKQAKKQKIKKEHNILNDTIMPQSFVSTQDDEDYDISDINFTADYDEEDEAPQEISKNLQNIVKEVSIEINSLFKLTCFNIDSIDVSAYDETTLLMEFRGNDAALLIGKEGYRYKALSYMIFNWINIKYKLQLRLEIAEFLQNQEESVARYLEGVYESIARDGRCQTKILDGVLIQIALRSLREKYADKYVAIRSTRDGLKYIIINDYHSK
jgi:spoIIIJ-associated protein